MTNVIDFSTGEVIEEVSAADILMSAVRQLKIAIENSK